MQSLIEQLAVDASSLSFTGKIFAGIQVAIFAMIIVFSVLIFLMYVIKLLGNVVTAQSKKAEDASKAQVSAPSAPAVAAPAVPAQDEKEIVAAVLAAIYATNSGSDSKIVIKNIVKKQDNWGTVGLLEQMNSRL